MGAPYRNLARMDNAITGAVWRPADKLLTISTAFSGDYDIPVAKMPQPFIDADDQGKQSLALSGDQQTLTWAALAITLKLADVPGLANARA